MIKRLLFIHFSLLTLIGFSQIHVFVDGEKFSEWDNADTLKLRAKTNLQIRNFWKEGYLFAGLDSTNKKRVFLHRGEKISIKDVDEGLVSFSQLIQKATNQLHAKINSGYPFVRLLWDSLRLENGRLSYHIKIEEGPLIKNDSIILLSSIKTKREFISRIIGMEKETLFREKDFNKIPAQLKRVSFLIQKKTPDLSFQDGKAWTYLDLEETSTGSFEGTLGVLPNQSGRRKALITGNLNLSLLNLFRSGKELDFEWERFGEGSQKLDLRYRYPFVVGSNLHIEGDFGLVKQDTSFINQQVGLKISSFVGGLRIRHCF